MMKAMFMENVISRKYGNDGTSWMVPSTIYISDK